MSNAKRPNVEGVLGALAMGEAEAEKRHETRTSKAKSEPKPGKQEVGEEPRRGRPRSDREQVTITLSPKALEIVERDLLARMQDKSLRPSERKIGPTIEALILEASTHRKR